MLRYLVVSLLLVISVTARFRGSSAFVVDDIEEYDQDGDIVTVAPTKMTNAPQLQTVHVQTTAETASSESTTSSGASSTEMTTTPDGHDPMEVVEASIDLLNTPFHRMVGSNPLRRLLRLVGPTKNDFLHTVKITQEVQKAAGLPTIAPPVSDLPPVVDHIFGFQESDNELFHKTTTLPPLFPIMPYDHDAVFKALNKIMAESAAKTTVAPLPKL